MHLIRPTCRATRHRPCGRSGDAPLEPYDNVLIPRQEFAATDRRSRRAVKSPGRYSLKSRQAPADLIQHTAGSPQRPIPAAYGSIARMREPAHGHRSVADHRHLGPRARDSLPRGLPERWASISRPFKDSSFRDNIILAGGDSVTFRPDPIVLVQGAVAPRGRSLRPGKNRLVCGRRRRLYQSVTSTDHT
jgi:hypothetical protein